MGGTEGWPSAWLLPGVGSGPRNAMVGPPGTPYPSHYLRAFCPQTHQPRPGLAFLAPENAPGTQVSRASGVPAGGQGENEDSSVMDSCPPETTSWLLLSPASRSLSVLICSVFCPPPSALTCLSHLSGQLSPSCFSVPLSPFFPPPPASLLIAGVSGPLPLPLLQTQTLRTEGCWAHGLQKGHVGKGSPLRSRNQCADTRGAKKDS